MNTKRVLHENRHPQIFTNMRLFPIIKKQPCFRFKILVRPKGNILMIISKKTIMINTFTGCAYLVYFFFFFTNLIRKNAVFHCYLTFLRRVNLKVFLLDCQPLGLALLRMSSPYPLYIFQFLFRNFKDSIDFVYGFFGHTSLFFSLQNHLSLFFLLLLHYQSWLRRYPQIVHEVSYFLEGFSLW